MISRLIPALTVVLAVAALAPSVSLAEPSSPAVEQRRQPPADADAESEYDRGLRARVAKDWVASVAAFHRALAMRPAFPEASTRVFSWSGAKTPQFIFDKAAKVGVQFASPDCENLH